MSLAGSSFGSVCHLVNGKAFKPTDWSDAGVPIIRIQNLNGPDKPFNYWAGALDNQVLVKTGDLLLAWSGTPGTSFGAHIWSGPNGILNQHIFRCDLDQRAITKEWARIAVNHRLHRLIEQAHGGVGLQHVTRGMVEDLEIPLPPLAEQRRIAEVLDWAEALRAKRRAALAQLDSLTQSIFLELLGNCRELKTKFLEQIVRDMHQGINTVTENIEYRTDGYPIIQSKHITQGYLDLSDARFVSEATFAKYKDKYSPEKNDLLLCNIGTIGNSLLMAENIDFLIAWNLFLIKLDVHQVLPCYCKHFFDHLAERHYFDQFLTGGTVKFISKKTLGATPIPLPPIELQREFARRVGAVEKLKSAQRASLAELDALFASLQHRAFRGEL